MDIDTTPDLWSSGEDCFSEEIIEAALEKRRSLDEKRESLKLAPFTIEDAISCQGAYTLTDFNDLGFTLEILEERVLDRLAEEMKDNFPAKDNVLTRDSHNRLLFPFSCLEIIESAFFRLLSRE